MRIFRAITSLSTIAALFAPTLVAAATFNPEHILTDAEIRDAEAMSLADITMFLARRGGLNVVVDVDPVDGLAKTAPKLIYDASRRYDINPEYILALLQKESSIVETPVPKQEQIDWAAGYALCDNCYKSLEAARVDCPSEPNAGECLRKAELAQKYKGFGRQVDAGAGWMDWYLDGALAGTLDGYRKPDQSYDIDGVTLKPSNIVTAALYSYTPHLHGNELLWRVMQRWFGAGDNQAFPDGTLVRNKRNGAVAVIQGGKFRPILKRSILMTRFRTATIVDLDDADFAALDKSNRGAPIRFSDLSLVRTETGDTHLLIGNVKRPIPTTQAFAALGFNPEEIEPVTAADIAEYVTGEPIVPDAAYPLGALVQDTRTGGVYYAESGVKHPIVDRSILVANFPGQKILPAKQGELALLADGTPVMFAEGSLVKASDAPSVFLISGGKKRVFPTARDFTTLGFRFASVRVASARALALHETGLPISLGLPDSTLVAVTTP